MESWLQPAEMTPIPDKLATFHDHQKLRVTPAEAGTPYLTLVFAFANQHIAPRK